MFPLIGGKEIHFCYTGFRNTSRREENFSSNFLGSVAEALEIILTNGRLTGENQFILVHAGCIHVAETQQGVTQKGG